MGDTSDLLNDISIASPSTLAQNITINQPVQPDGDAIKKAKLRLETVCLLLAENGAKQSLSEKEKQ